MTQKIIIVRFALISSLLMLIFSLHSKVEEEFSFYLFSHDNIVEVSSYFEEEYLMTSSQVEIINEDQWKIFGAKRTDDAISHLPSTFVTPTLGGANIIAIRGYTSNLSIRGHATLLDGVPLNSLSWGTARYDKPNIELGILSQIEMIRGPGSTLYGSDAFHGVYSLETINWTENRKLIDLSYGTDYAQTHFKWSHELKNGCRQNIALGHSTQSDLNINYTSPSNKQGKRHYEYDSTSIVWKIKTDSDFLERFFIDTGLYFSSFESLGFPGVGSQLLDDKDQTNLDSSFTIGKLNLTWKIQDQLSMELKSFYWESDSEFQHQFLLNSELHQGQEEYRYGTELVFKKEIELLKTQIVFSYNYNYAKITDTRLEIETGPLKNLFDGSQPFQGLDRTTQSGLFNIKNTFNDYFHMVYGIRLDHYSDFGSQLSPRATFIYQLSKESVIKLLYSNAFRAAVGGELTFAGKIKGDPSIKPETIDNFEIIYLKQLEHLKFNLTLFKNKWKDAIIIVPRDDLGSQFDSEYQNQGKNRSFGIESSMKYHIANWDFDLNASFVESKDELRDEQYTAFPEYIFNIGVGYQFFSNPIYLFFNHHMMFNWKEQVFESFYNDVNDLKDYHQSDLALRWDIFYGQFHFHISNLFKQKNKTPALWGSPGGIPEYPDQKITIRFSKKI